MNEDETLIWVNLKVFNQLAQFLTHSSVSETILHRSMCLINFIVASFDTTTESVDLLCESIESVNQLSGFYQSQLH